MKKSIRNIEKLAKKRTFLAVERTYLSHLRTASAFAAFGLGIFKLFNGFTSLLISSVFIVLSLFIVLIGTYTFINRRKE